MTEDNEPDGRVRVTEHHNWYGDTLDITTITEDADGDVRIHRTSEWIGDTDD